MILQDEAYWKSNSSNHLLIGKPGQVYMLVQALLQLYNGEAVHSYHPDFFLFEEKMKIDAVRLLEHSVSLIPWNKHRVVLIQNFATQESWNALLKLLEETPLHTSIFIRTLEPGSIPDTVRSRLKVYHLGVEKEDTKEFNKEGPFWKIFNENINLAKKPRAELEQDLAKFSRYSLNSGEFEEAAIFNQASKRISSNTNLLLTLDNMLLDLFLAWNRKAVK